MNKIFLIALLSLLFCFKAQAQSCLPSGISFTTQAEVDNFKNDYPGCTVIEGDVIIEQSTVSNLNGLDEITVIRGGLSIRANIWVSNLDGLQNLDTLGGRLQIEGNEQLNSISGLSKIKTIPGRLFVNGNASLNTLDGLQNVTSIGEELMIEYQGNFPDLSPLSNLTSIGGGIQFNYLPLLTDLNDLGNLQFVGGPVTIRNCNGLLNLNGLNRLDSINGTLFIADNFVLADLSGLDSVQSVNGDLLVERCNKLENLEGLNRLTKVNGILRLSELPELSTIAALGNLNSLLGNLEIQYNAQLPNLQGLEGLTFASQLFLVQNPALISLSGLDNVAAAGNVQILDNLSLIDLSALNKLTGIPGVLSITGNTQLASLNGLQNIDSVGYFVYIISNPALTSLTGLESLRRIGDFFSLNNNSTLSSLAGLESLVSVGGLFEITGNPQLADCAVQSVCLHLFLTPQNMIIASNAPGCNDPAEVAGQCQTVQVLATVLSDPDGDCLPDAANLPAPGVSVRLAGIVQTELKPGNANGQAAFEYIDQSIVTLSLPQLPSQNWAVCQNNQQFNPDNVAAGDTIRATFLLKPILQCPELEVHLGLPAAFRDCATATEVKVSIRNIGTVDAQGVVTAVVMPPAFELWSAVPPLSGQIGDTLFFDNGDLPPFAEAQVSMKVRTICNGFQSGQSFCWEAFSKLQNACTNTPPAASEIKLSATCAGDSLHFTLKNIGAAPTQNPHTYTIIRNKYIHSTQTFSLAPQESLSLAVPADGATWRMEATKRDDGTRTATALENCGGLTPGLLAAFWLDKGPLEYDTDCRQVVDVFTPVQKYASPSGVGATHLLSADQPVQYTVDFQNMGSDTVWQLLIQDLLPTGLDINTFRPIAASHPYSWQIRSGNNLEVLFTDIALPDSNTNKEGSRGYFTFSIAQNPGLPAGAALQNWASVTFDNDPPVQTGLAFHTIGEPFPVGYSCGTGNITFYDQLDVDNFEIYYPGCQVIEGGVAILPGVSNLDGLGEIISMGFLAIQNNSSLTDLAGLQSLVSFGGLLIEGNTALTNLNGLNKVKTSGQYDISIENNPSLVSLEGLNQLESVGAGLRILNNPVLADLNPLSNLVSVGGHFALGGNGSIQNLSGLENLTKVGGTLGIVSNVALSGLSALLQLDTIGAGLNIESNPELVDLAGLDSLKWVGGTVSILQNEILSGLYGLGSLDFVGGDFQLENNLSLFEVNGVEKLRSVGGGIMIHNNSLLSIGGFYQLVSVGGNFEVSDNPYLQTLNGFYLVDTIGGNLYINFNNLEAGLYTFDNLRHIGGSLYINDNPMLPAFDGLHQLATIGGALSIQVNPLLTAFNGLENLQTIGDAVVIGRNPALLNLSGLDNLTSVGAHFIIHNSNSLTDLSGLGKLKTIGSDLQIAFNDAMLNLNGLNQLDSLGGSLLIQDNAALTDLDGLQSLPAIADSLVIENNPALINVNGLNNLASVTDEVRLYNNSALASLNGLNSLNTIGQNFFTQNNGLPDFTGLGNLDSIGGNFIVYNSVLESFGGLNSLKFVGGNLDIEYNYGLQSLNGLNNLATVGSSIYISLYNGLLNLEGLENLTHLGAHLSIDDCPFLTNLNGLNSLSVIPGGLNIFLNPALTNLDGLNSLVSIGQILKVENNTSLASWDGLTNLKSVEGTAVILNNLALGNINGLGKLESVGQALIIAQNGQLTTIDSLKNLLSIGGDLAIYNNPVLMNLNGLSNLNSIAGDNLDIQNNPMLEECSVFAVCNYLYNMPGSVNISNNAPGCGTPSEVEGKCQSTPVLVELLLDNNADCQTDAADTRVADIQVHLAGNTQMSLRPSDSGGIAFFKYFEPGPFTLHLPQFPTGNWAACQDEIMLTPGGAQDTVKATFLLKPTGQCPELTLRLGLPSVFRGCLVNSEVQVSTQNTGTILAEGVRTAVVIPPVFDLVAAAPLVSAQSGDTLFFELGDLKPFETGVVKLTLKTKCDTFLFGQTLCLEAFATLDNPCANTLPAFSEIKLSAQCLGDTAVRFTIKNIGDAPTQAPHTYRILRNEAVLETGSFALNNQQSMVVEVPADGATYRMEATKLDNGTETAVALENCAGLTPGQIIAFWLEKGPLDYDFDCREVIGSFDPNQKTAVPVGAGPDHTIEANRPLQYTIDFQNTGTDTAYRVLLRDVLPPDLDLSTFRPGAASHSYTWEIRGQNVLDVLFFPIMLPDSNVNEPASHGFFSFEIDQKPDLPDNTYFYNTASIVFDFNPPIVTNTVFHRIGQLTVQADEPQQHARLWQVLGNPTRDAATFRALEFIPGEKRFELFDAGGRLVRRAQFAGQVFDFQRDMLPEGLYFFRILDEGGRGFSGKIVVAD